MFKKKKVVEKPSAADELSKLILELPNAIQQSVATGMSTALKGFKPQQAPPTKQAPAPKKEEPLIPEGTDLEELSNSDMLNLMFKGMEQKLTEFAGKIDPQFEKLSSNAQIKDIKDQVKDILKDNPDFPRYREAMTEVANRYPDLDPQDIFNLAKINAPEIGVQIAKEKEEAEGDKTDNVVSFGGLTPTSGHSSEDTEGMDFESASEKAWDSVMGEMPPEIIGGRNN